MDLDSRFKLSSVVECVAAHAAENPEKLALADARINLLYCYYQLRFAACLFQ